ncbi:MAG: DUF3086 domain-containing protein [Cyanobacteria bacterium J06623_7]
MNSENPSVPKSDNIDNPELEFLELDSPQADALETDTAETTNFSEDVWSTSASESADDEIVLEAEIATDTAVDFADLESELETSTPQADLDEPAAAEVELEPTVTTTEEPKPEPEPEPELFVDTWLDETKAAEPEPPKVKTDEANAALDLEPQKASLQQEIAELQASKEQLMADLNAARESMGRLIEEGTKELQERKANLRIEIDKLERRKERIDREMRSNFAGSSKELAIRVQGFKEYLVGSLQDLATAAEKLELSRSEAPPQRNRERMVERGNLRPANREGDRGRNRERLGNSGNLGSRRDRNENPRNRNRDRNASRTRGSSDRSATAQFNEPTFADQSRRIRQLLDQYCNSPDYYGAPWQLRRTFDQKQAQKVQEWFFTQGGRGAVDSTGSRLQNILLASATISILHDIYRDRTQVLVLTDTPENLGEWRKGLEDCLGISRRDFGANRGVVLFDSPEVLVQRAERLLADKLLPIIIIDETEELLNLSVLKFPIWLAFASANKPNSANYLY